MPTAGGTAASRVAPAPIRVIPLIVVRTGPSWPQFHEPGSLDCLLTFHFAPGWGEGWVRTMAHPGVDCFDANLGSTFSSTNPHGFKPPCRGTFKGLRPHDKRSCKRAKNRAARDGFAWYKGKLLDRKQFNCAPLPPAVPASNPTCPPPNRPGTLDFVLIFFGFDYYFLGVGSLSSFFWNLDSRFSTQWGQKFLFCY